MGLVRRLMCEKTIDARIAGTHSHCLFGHIYEDVLSSNKDSSTVSSEERNMLKSLRCPSIL